MGKKKPRVSLTKAQVQAGLGAELLVLCQSVTEDGSLSKDEILALRAWLETNRSSDLPAIGFLATTLERIIADGRVTKEERKELYQAIEAVLPPELRKEAKQQRKAVEAEQKAKEREERESQKQEEREARERQRPHCSANFMVAGVHYEGRPQVIDRFAFDGDTVFLVRDPQNRFSRHAVEVRLKNGMQIGYVPEEDAEELADFLDRGCPHRAYITKLLTWGRVPIPVVQAYIHRTEAEVEGLVFPNAVPEKRFYTGGRDHESPPKSGCFSAILLAAVPVVVWLVRSFR